jgi:hypothetical protein
MKLRFVVALCACLFLANLLPNTQLAANKQQKGEYIEKQRHRIVWMFKNDESINAEPPTHYVRASRGNGKIWDQLENPCGSSSLGAARKIKQAGSSEGLKRFGDEASLIRPGRRLGGMSRSRDSMSPKTR